MNLHSKPRSVTKSTSCAIFSLDSNPRKPMKPFRLAIIILIVTHLSAFVGCGPIQSTSRISDATVALERARVNDADIKAPYEYYSARFYLHKAQEEWGYSDFEASYEYAKEAKRAADAANLKAKEDPWTGSPVDQNIDNESMRDKGASSIDMKEVKKPSKKKAQKEKKEETKSTEVKP